MIKGLGVVCSIFSQADSTCGVVRPRSGCAAGVLSRPDLPRVVVTVPTTSRITATAAAMSQTPAGRDRPAVRSDSLSAGFRSTSAISRSASRSAAEAGMWSSASVGNCWERRRLKACRPLRRIMVCLPTRVTRESGRYQVRGRFCRRRPGRPPTGDGLGTIAQRWSPR